MGLIICLTFSASIGTYPDIFGKLELKVKSESTPKSSEPLVCHRIVDRTDSRTIEIPRHLYKH